MTKHIESYINPFPSLIQERYHQLVELLVSIEPTLLPYIWAGVPTFQKDNHYVRFILFKDHININTSLGISVNELKPNYKITPKGMVQVFTHEPLDLTWMALLFRTVFYKV